MKSHQPVFFGSVLDLAAFRRIFPVGQLEHGAAKQNDPYNFVALDCWGVINTLPPYDQDVLITMDQNCEFHRTARDLFHEFTDGFGRTVPNGTDGLEFNDAKNTPGLQAADVVAWEINKHVTEQIKATGRDTRKSLTHLLTLNINPQYIAEWNEERLLNLAATNARHAANAL